MASHGVLAKPFMRVGVARCEERRAPAQCPRTPAGDPRLACPVLANPGARSALRAHGGSVAFTPTGDRGARRLARCGDCDRPPSRQDLVEATGGTASPAGAGLATQKRAA